MSIWFLIVAEWIILILAVMLAAYALNRQLHR
jgi:hypothetical protein